MVVAPVSLIVIWRDGFEGNRRRFTLRRILPDGHFFGEATFYDERRCANLQGTLTTDDTAEVWRLAGAIRKTASANGGTEDASQWDGLLAEGAYSAPNIIYRYCAGEEDSVHVAGDFKALTALLRRYLEPDRGASPEATD